MEPQELDITQFNREGTELRKLQIRMLEMMVEIDAICRKHNIPYWLSSGTALGAVRHGGFIPWDDDLDIEIFRKDYKRLVKVLKMELPSSMAIQTTNTDKGYISQHAKVRDLRSEITEDNNANINYKYKGVFIDIFPMERTTLFLSGLSCKLYSPLYKMIRKRNDKWGLKQSYQRTLLFIYEKIVFPFFRWFSWLAPKGHLRYSLGIGFFTDRDIKEILPVKEINFEGRLFFAPNNTDAYLTRMYGNYMEIPPMDKIEKHIFAVKYKD